MSVERKRWIRTIPRGQFPRVSTKNCPVRNCFVLISPACNTASRVQLVISTSNAPARLRHWPLCITWSAKTPVFDVVVSALPSKYISTPVARFYCGLRRKPPVPFPLKHSGLFYIDQHLTTVHPYFKFMWKSYWSKRAENLPQGTITICISLWAHQPTIFIKEVSNISTITTMRHIQLTSNAHIFQANHQCTDMS